MAKTTKTVKEYEAEIGKPDSLRNPNGSNTKSNKKMSNHEAEFKKLIPKLTSPKRKIAKITIEDDKGNTIVLTGAKATGAATVLNGGNFLSEWSKP